MKIQNKKDQLRLNNRNYDIAKIIDILQFVEEWKSTMLCKRIIEDLGILDEIKLYHIRQASIRDLARYIKIHESDVGTDNIALLKQNIPFIKKLCSPVGQYLECDIQCRHNLECLIEELILCTRYAKSDELSVAKRISIFSRHLQDYNLHSIGRGVDYWCKNHAHFPSIKELIDIIIPYHGRSTRLFNDLLFIIYGEN
jgi:hypothetical protein